MLEKIRPESGARRTIIDYGLTALIAVALAILVQSFVVKPYLIPSTSMANTLVPGQRVLVDRLVYHYRARCIAATSSSSAAPSRPTTCSSSASWACPATCSRVRGGHLYVNGVQADDPFVDKVDGVTEPTDPADPYASTQPDAPWSLAHARSACRPATTS